MQIKLHDLKSNYRQILPDNVEHGPYSDDDKPVKFSSIQTLLMKQIRLPIITAGTLYPLTATIQPVINIT
jgi:hypothetical protein